MDDRFGTRSFSSQSVGPTFGQTVANTAIIAIIVSLLVISAYIALRFEWKYAVPVLIALMHDVLITGGVYSLVGREVTASTVAALLTILGFSLYDTIIVFDRIRENVPRMPRAAFSQIVNRSMSEVLTRSLATSFCTALPVLALLLFGGETLKDFAFALLVGVASGTYSSVFIAGPVLTHWKEREPLYARRRLRIASEFGGVVPAYATSGSAAVEVAPSEKQRPQRRITTPEPGGRFAGRVPGAGPRPARRRAQARPGGRPRSRGRGDAEGRRRRKDPHRRGHAEAQARQAEASAQSTPREGSLMGALAWVMMGLAIWHFTIFLPDRFWGGIVGAFLGALAGAMIFGLAINGGAIPGQDDTELITALEASRARSRASPRLLRGRDGARSAVTRRALMAGDRASLARGRSPSGPPLSSTAWPPRLHATGRPRCPRLRCARDARGRARRCGRVPAPTPAGPRLLIEPCPLADALRLEAELGVSHPVAQVLVRRGLADPAAARAWLAADDTHPLTAFGGIEEAVALVAAPHRPRDSRITVHGDYDVDGVSSTTLLVGALRALGADADWYLPSRFDDGYGLSKATVDRLAARGTRLLITVDCGITAVEEVAHARAAGLDVLVTDHHTPRADGALPDAPILHPVLGNYPCPHLCATAVAHKLASALREAVGQPAPDEDLDLVALATIADVVPLQGENRSLVRRGLKALAATTRPGSAPSSRSRAWTRARRTSGPSASRLGPRINAAGRLGRADAGVELLLTDDPDRARAIAQELDAANRDRRHTETRIVFEAEAQVAEAGDAAAYVLAGQGWHPGVVGIVASRIAERHHRPTVVIALDGERGTGSGRSIPGFDLLAGLEACKGHLFRHGGHRAAAGLEIATDEIDAFRAAFAAHAAEVLRPDDLVPSVRVDAVVSGEEMGMALAEELQALAPFGAGNPSVTLLVPAARISASTPMGEGKHVRFTIESGSVRSQGVAFGNGGRLPVALDEPVDATFGLELSEYRGVVESRLVLKHVRDCVPGRIEVVGEPTEYLAAVWDELDRTLDASRSVTAVAAARQLRDRREVGPAGTIAGLVATGEDVLVVCADAPRRSRQLASRLGGFALCSYSALEREPALADAFTHVVALDPPAHAHHDELLRCGAGFTHLAWGQAELRFAQQVHELEYGLRASLAALYRDARAAGGAEGEALEEMLRGSGPHPRSPALAGRLLRVLAELELVLVQRGRPALDVPPAERTALERSPAFRAYEARYEDGIRFLTTATARAA